MFFIGKNRGRISNRNGRSRKLRIEGLESKQMLSATNPLTSVADSGSETVSVQVGDMDSSSDLTIAVNQEILNASSAFVGPERSHEEAVRIIERHRDEMRLLWTNGLNSSATLDSGESEVSNASTVEQSALTICQVYVEVIDSISPLSMFASSGGSGGGPPGVLAAVKHLVAS